jgi:hypothetical protein
MDYSASRERAKAAEGRLKRTETVSLESIRPHGPAASETHRQKIMRHEFAHMILRHKQEVVSHDDAKVFSDLGPERWSPHSGAPASSMSPR